MKKLAYILLIIVAGLCLAFILGPKAPTPDLDPTPMELDIPLAELDDFVNTHESGFKTLKPDNEASITWYQDSIQKTSYSVVFLHGFSATKMEGRPITTEFATKYGCNLYESRLFAHGLDTADAMIDITPENYLESAKKAIAIGKLMGDSVIVISSSTGSTLGLYLAANDPLISAVLCYSPNIDIADPNSKMLTGPWGLELARLIFGDVFREYEATEEFKNYWVNRYRLEALITMRSLLDATMTEETFSKIKQPVFVGCWYKNEEVQDPIVSVAAMREMMGQLGTSTHKSTFVAFKDVEAHIITSPLRCKDLETVKTETFTFAERILGLHPVNDGNPKKTQP